MEEGDRVSIEGRQHGSYWYDCKIVYLSECKRYATIRGKISWGRNKKSHEITVSIDELKPEKVKKNGK